MSETFRKISRVGRLNGATKWYLSDDCLLAAKRTMYVVHYRRFYLRDLESTVVWRSPGWIYRAIIPGALLVMLGALLWYTVNLMSGSIFAGIGLAWAGLEFALGPTALGRIQTTGATVDSPLVKRFRRAERVLARIDVAVIAARGDVVKEPATPSAELRYEPPAMPNSSQAAGATAAVGDAD